MDGVAQHISNGVSPPCTLRWRKGELIGSGAYGRVYMGLNLDSGELIAVKQVLVTANSVTKEKAQAHMRELEEEVRLLKNLSHPNIVRYLGTAREEEALNIFLEFVSGGSIASLLGKFGSFTEPVIRMYTRQLLVGLDYLHSNRIMHRDIKGANILVDNQGCIKLADFGASKKVVELATISEAKSMKGTPYWMAPEVIRQTGHNWQADIWSVGCTVIEMATGKPPWSQQFQEVAALFHIGTTKSHPPIPDHLSADAKDFLYKCLQREPRRRPSASELLKHPFVLRGDQSYSHLGPSTCLRDSMIPSISTSNDKKNGVNGFIPTRSPSCLQQMRIPSMDDQNCSVRLDSPSFDFDAEDQSFNPVCESSYVGADSLQLSSTDNKHVGHNKQESSNQGECIADAAIYEDDEVTEAKIRVFLDEKALELKKLQSPLYEELYSLRDTPHLGLPNVSFVPPLSPAGGRLPAVSSKSPSKKSSLSGRSVAISSLETETSVDSESPHCSGAQSMNFILHDVPSPRLHELDGLLLQDHQQPISSPSICDRKKQWEEELQQELEIKREEKRKLARHATNSISPQEKSPRYYTNQLQISKQQQPPLVESTRYSLSTKMFEYCSSIRGINKFQTTVLSLFTNRKRQINEVLAFKY
ncbi:hypothetical protein O6H91_12G042800 [Diphasiastrum complanatum]|uniref:Uncharacterized protein n=1 Tax=Diphasiastrum complanatum TaxID=34168 RepID=A0ACC2C0Z7_DIPCM|nr:hypothetical protein O6H91_12G042800 [Diphasiastrum complanatum]